MSTAGGNMISHIRIRTLNLDAFTKPQQSSIRRLVSPIDLFSSLVLRSQINSYFYNNLSEILPDRPGRKLSLDPSGNQKLDL